MLLAEDVVDAVAGNDIARGRLLEQRDAVRRVLVAVDAGPGSVLAAGAPVTGARVLLARRPELGTVATEPPPIVDVGEFKDVIRHFMLGERHRRVTEETVHSWPCAEEVCNGFPRTVREQYTMREFNTIRPG